MKQFIRFHLVLIVLHFISNYSLAQVASVCCPFIGWDYVVPITITNNSGVATTNNLQTLFVVNTQLPISQGKMQANGNDIRFAYNTCGNYLDYYIENGINTAQTNIWVRLPAIPNGGSITLYMYYGNAAAAASAVSFNAMFPSVLTINAPTTLAGNQVFDWIDVQAGGAISINAGVPVSFQARKIIFNGSFNGANLGYGPEAGPGAGQNGGGGCGGGGGGYGGNGGGGGCNPGGAAYGTANGIDIDMGSGGGGSDCPASARGGGAISLIASVIVLNGNFNVTGQSIAGQCCCNNSSEAPGGGSAGGVMIVSDFLSGSATIDARGGRGQDSDDKEGGGGGAGGRVKLLWTTNNAFAGNANVTGGANGNGGQGGMQPGASGTFTQPQIQGLVITPAPEIPVSIPTANFTFNNVCLNTLATFNDASTVAPQGTITQWAWNFGDGIGTSAQQNPTYTYTVANTYTVTLTTTSVSGCTDDTTAQITVSALPIADFTTQNVCEGNSATFTDGSSAGVTQWAWNFGDGTGTSAQQSPLYNYASSGNFNVTLITANAANCADTITKPINVQASPTATYTVSPLGGNCVGQPFVFNDNSVGTPGNNLTRFWNFGDGTNGVAQTDTIIYTIADTFLSYLVVTDQIGCRDTAFETIEVYPNPVASFVALPVCLGQTMVFAGDDATQVPPTFTWTFGDGSPEETDFDTLINHTFSSSGSFNVQLVVNGLNNCADTIVQPVIVNANPVANFDVASVCLGLSAQFNDASTAGSNTTITNWQWNFGDAGATDSIQNPTYTYNNTGSYNISLQVTDGNGCIDDTTLQVTVFENPIVDFTATPACFGESNGSVTALPTNGIAPYAFNWDNGQTTETAINLAAGNFNVTITDNNGCTVSGNAAVTQPSQPLIISVVPDTFSIPFGDTVSFNISNNYYDSIIYSIAPNYNISCTNCDSVFAFPYQTTTYTIEAADSNGCAAQASVNVNVEEKYILYVPNAFTPNGDGINDVLQVYAKGLKQYYFIIYNRWGEKVFEAEENNSLTWDGTYFGKPLKPDVYVYKVQLVYLTGKTAEQKGSISILK